MTDTAHTTDQSNSTDNEAIMNSSDIIKKLFENFLEEGGTPHVTKFRAHLNALTHQHDNLKSMFGGRGKKWVTVALGEISLTISRLESEGIDCDDYKTFTEAKGAAWIRFSGPRVANGKRCAAFEVRTPGSTIDCPKQLHYIPVDILEETIRFMDGTPHSLNFEVAAQPVVVEDEEPNFDGFDDGYEEQELSAYETEVNDEPMPADFGLDDEGLEELISDDDLDDDDDDI